MKLFFSTLVLYAKIIHSIFRHADQVAAALKVSHCDCSEMTKNTLYAINQIPTCHITPGEIEISNARSTLFTKTFREKLNATKCRIKHHMDKKQCGHLDYSSIDPSIAGINSDLFISTENSRNLGKGGNIKLQATGLMPRSQALKNFVTQPSPTGIFPKKSEYFVIPSLSTSKEQL